MPNVTIEKAWIGCVKMEGVEDPYKENFVKTAGFDENGEEKTGAPQDVKVDIDPSKLNQVLAYRKKIIFDPNADDQGFGITDLIKEELSDYKKLRDNLIPKSIYEDKYATALVIDYKSDVNYKLVLLKEEEYTSFLTGYKFFDSDGNVIQKRVGEFFDKTVTLNLGSTKPKKDKPEGPIDWAKREAGFGTNSLDEGEPTNPTVKAVVGAIGAPFGVDPVNIDIVSHWITNNPMLSTAILALGASQAIPLLAPILGGLFSGGKFGTVLTYGAIAAALYKFGPDMLKALQGGGSSGEWQGILPFLSNVVFGPDATGDYIVYDAGKEIDKKNTATYQRCLIRIGGGNLEAERRNYQPPVYNPIIGVKIPGKKNYADDGRFGQWTLDASRKLFRVINQLNQGEIANNPKFKIKDPARVPVEILISPACAGEIDMQPTAEEIANADKKTNLNKAPKAAPAAPTEADKAAAEESVKKAFSWATDTSKLGQSGGGTADLIGGIDLNSIMASPEYKAVKAANDSASDLASETINNKFAELNQKLNNFSSLYNSKKMSKEQLQTELQNALQEAQNTSTMGSGDAAKFKQAVITFLTSLSQQISTLQESKRINKKAIKESKVYKEYGFLSAKNERLHSVLMEQLIKDLKKRG